MNYKKHLKQTHGASITLSIFVLAIVLVLGTLIAEQQRSALAQLAGDVERESLPIDVKMLLLNRRVIEVTNRHPNINAAFDSLFKQQKIPLSILHLDQYLQASRVVNSEFRNNPAAAEKILVRQNDDSVNAVSLEVTEQSSAKLAPTEATTEVVDSKNTSSSPSAARDVIPIPWYVIFFGYEQYVCFFLAALCFGELRTIRQRLKAEQHLSTNTAEKIRLNIVGDSEIDTGSTQAVIHEFNKAVAELVYGVKDSYSNDQLQKMQRYTWAAMVNNLLEVYRRTGDRIQSLEAATSSHESAQVRFDGSFHFEQYLQWAIPSIGFLGTIRGIAAAMGAAQVADDLPIVVSYLGIAFYSTMTALILNLLLMGIRAGTLNRADQVFAGLDETLRRDVVPRLATRFVLPTQQPPPNGA